jgi:hypothetical protein
MTEPAESMTASATRTDHHQHHTPSRRALATRSFAAVMRLTGEARREALCEHFERFVPSMSRSCPSHR